MKAGGDRVAIVGVSGVVGETLLQVLEERRVPIRELGAFASCDRSEPLVYRGRPWPVRRATTRALADAHFDVVFFASNEDASADLAESCAASGALVIDNSATFRLRADLPLIVPEVNAQAVGAGQRIFPVANCTAILLSVALAPIARTAGLRSVRVATYQAVSGAGRAGLDALAREEQGQKSLQPTFPAPIFHNVVPQIGELDERGNTSEETKLAAETRKILGLPMLHVAATAVRVPVLRAHAAAVFFETMRDTSASELGDALAGADGVVFHHGGIATPRDAEGGDRVHVARLRAETASQRYFQLWLVGDQLRKGAATNAVQILQLVMHKNASDTKPGRDGILSSTASDGSFI
ncbi:MAG: aspartate-semialdehyde dehydrogenase [Candidatus Eremiobacteraeota bacterium]|nr:aspartate-semialdehyde dehydrogenase [Candidatus Eremiobacteraeota bacterium]